MQLDHIELKHKRTVALTILLLLSVIITSGLVLPVLTQYQDNQIEIAKLESRLRIYQNKITSRELIIQQTSDITKSVYELGIFSRQRSIPLATADMQQQIKNAVISSGGELTSTENLANQVLDGLLKLSINVRFSGRVETLKNVLYEIEAAKPYLLVEKIKILGVAGQRNIETGKVEPVDKVYISADIASFLPNISSVSK